MDFPATVYYSPEHLWVMPDESGHWLAGITDYAQDLLGDIVFVDTPAIGSTLVAGVACGLVESVKTGSDLHAPMAGIVTEINTEIANRPELLNDQPYSTWIFKFQPDDPSQLGALLNADRYQHLIGV